MIKILTRVGICICTSAFCIYSYIDRQNQLTHLKIQIPIVEKEIQSLREQTKKLHYEIDRFENPSHLLELTRMPQFSHLRHPLLRDILTLGEGIALQEENHWGKDVP